MSKFSYRSLTSGQFRLLTLLPGGESTQIQTRLRHVNLEDKPSFDALSYEWGPESSNNSQIRVDDELFTIRRNLWLFLKRLRASSQDAQQIYVDAICINQENREEKGRQVALMSEIYMRAKKVLVWLGEHDPSSEKVFGTELLDYITEAPAAIRPLALPVALPLTLLRAGSKVFQSSTDRTAAWTSLLSRSYWNRTWIVQEFLLARSVIIFCGSDHMSGDLIFTKPLQDHFSRMIQKNRRKKKGEMDGIPRSFLLYLWKKNQKRHGLFGRGKPYFPNIDIFELAFNFQYTECQNVVDHVYGLLALEDPSKGPPITPNYDISAQKLFIEICMLRLATATGSGVKVSNDGMSHVAKLFRGLRLTFDNAEEILDILFDEDQSKTQNSIGIAIIAKAFDQFGILKPERKRWIMPHTMAGLTAEQIISLTRQWRTTQKKSGNWYDIHPTAQIHDPPGMEFLSLQDPAWSRYSTLRNTATRRAAAANAQNMSNMNMNIMNANNLAAMTPGMGFPGGGGA